MNVTLVSWADLRSGAFIAAHRLLVALNSAAVPAEMVVAHKFGLSKNVLGPTRPFDKIASVATPLLDVLPVMLYRERKPVNFSTSFLFDRLLPRVTATGPDLVHLHWINCGFVNPFTIRKFRKPVIWTFHDMWPMTGGCHYSDGCFNYENRCGACPALGSNRSRDLSTWVWRRKRRAWQDLEITVIAPSRWMATCAQRSSLFAVSRIVVIPYCLDTECFRPLDKAMCRDFLGLPQDAFIVLFIAMNADRDLRKGPDLLRDALLRLERYSISRPLKAVVVGAEAFEVPSRIPVQAMGLLKDETSLSLVYNAADVCVSASRQDNLPNTLLESMSCGTPCVAFDIGGVSDLVAHQETGFLARPGDSASLAEGIAWVLADERRKRSLGAACRTKVLRENAQGVVASRHKALYEEVLAKAERICPAGN